MKVKILNRLCFECPLDDCKTPCPFGVDDNDCADEFLVDDFKKKEDAKEYRRSYYQKHKEKFREYRKIYYQAHKDRCKSYGRSYYQKNKEKVKEKNKAYAQKRKEKFKEKFNNYMKNKYKLLEGR